MKRSVLVGFVFFMICSQGNLRGQTPGPSNDREEILRLNRELTDAFARRDAEALNRLLADDYTMVSPRGRLIVKDAYLQSRVGSGPVTQTEQFDQVSIRLYGTTAIVTSRFTAQFLEAPLRK
jgi:ketosteroid isomerase-like protein